MYIFGIDHGAKTGCAYIVNNQIVFATRFSVKGEKDQDKFLDFYKKLDKMLGKLKVDVIALEKPMSFKNAFTSRLLIGYYSIAMLVAAERNIQVVEVYPSSMKKEIAGNGRATKEEVCDSLVNRYPTIKKEDIVDIEYYKRKEGIKNIDYDKSDALGLATYACLKIEKELSVPVKS